MANMNEPPIIMIVEDHDLLRSLINDLLRVNLPACSIHEAKSGDETISTAIALKPDVMIIDFSIRGMGSLDVTRSIKDRCSDTKVVILSDYDSSIYLEAIKKAGAYAYVLKSELSDDLIPLLSGVLSQRENTA